MGILTPLFDSLVWCYQFLVHDNFHPIVPQEAYRSAQMSHAKLRTVIQTLGIKSVIDLRCGVPDRDENGQHEGTVAKALGANYFHVPFVTSAIPYREQIAELLWIFDNAPRPVIMHCASGQHRTGTGACVWLLSQHPELEEKAYGQLSVKYGFFPFEYWLSKVKHGREPLAQMVTRFRNRKDTSEQFRSWCLRELAPLPTEHRSHLKDLGAGRVRSFNPYCNNREADL